MAVKELRESLKLKPHPEGGFYFETFRDESVMMQISALPSRFKLGRPVSTAVYFLLPSGSTSKMHRIPAAEVLHFYDGEPLTVVEIDETGHPKYTVLGKDTAAGQLFQYVIPPYVWFGFFPTMDYGLQGDTGAIQALAKRDSEEHYSLIGCTVAPAFQFEDLEFGVRSALLGLYPNARAAIEILTDAE